MYSFHTHFFKKYTSLHFFTLLPIQIQQMDFILTALLLLLFPVQAQLVGFHNNVINRNQSYGNFQQKLYDKVVRNILKYSLWHLDLDLFMQISSPSLSHDTFSGINIKQKIKYGYGRVIGGYYVGGQSMDEPPASNYQNVPPGSGGNGPVGNAWEWQRFQQQLLVLRERVDQLEREASGMRIEGC